MRLKPYLAPLLRWAWLLVIAALAAAAVAYAVSLKLPPVYQAQVSVLVRTAQAVTPSEAGGATLSTDQLSRTYAQLMVEPPVLNSVITDLGLRTSAAELRTRVTVTGVPGTAILVVAVRDTDRRLSRDIADKIVANFIAQTKQRQDQEVAHYTAGLRTQIQQVETAINDNQAKIDRLRGQTTLTPDQLSAANSLQQQVSSDRAQDAALLSNLAQIEGQALRSSDSLAVIAPPTVPSEPISPLPLRNAALAGLAGLLLALALILLLEYLDQTIKSEAQVTDATGMMTLGRIAHRVTGGERQSELVTLGGHEPTAESYKALRTNLLFSAVDKEVKTIVVTSALPGEGKSRTAANLAAVLAEAGHNTLLIDADFRLPSQHRIFGKIRNVGLANLILNERPDTELVLPVERIKNLWLLPSGTSPPNPSELLGSGLMRSLLARFRQSFGYVIVDTPPVAAVTDACVLAAQADGTIVVVEQGRTPMPALVHSVAALDRVGARVLGIVMNKVKSPGEGSDLYYGQYGGEYGQKAKPRGDKSREAKQPEEKQPAATTR